MLDIHTQGTNHGQDALHDSAFLFSGSFDDNSFCRGPQFLKPIATSLTKHTPTISYPFRSITSPASESPASELDAEDCAVLEDEDEYSEDELPPSPRRRHSGAISISSEDLPFCYDREALRRDTAAHRARHQQQLQKLRSGSRMGAFAVHEDWDTEIDGPHMSVCVPKSSASGHTETRRTMGPHPMSSGSDASRPKKETQMQQPVSDIDGPMMALWGV